ncbi:MAG: septum formation initiator family protein [Odoribacteraceae bacterium]|nr:septum formation initiator family protein [Odoribacteraceae bacterium]
MQEKHTGENSAQRGFARRSRRYIVALLLFLAWILLDQNSLIERWRLRSELRALEREQAYYRETAADNIRKIDELQGDREKLEKFAREQYLMKRPDEDIFIIDD